jgi:hypothetical protein
VGNDDTSTPPHTDAGAGNEGASTSPQTVGSCGNLATRDIWEDITPPEVVLPGLPNFPYGVAGFVLDPKNAGTVYVGASKQGLWKSTDCGSTWIHANTGTAGPMCGWTNEPCSKVLDGAQWWSLAIDPSDSQVLYAVNGAGTYSAGVFKSTNGGVDWMHVWPPENAAPNQYAGAPDFVANLMLDPYDHQHLLIDFHTNCTTPYVGLCLGESLDGGMTWRIANGDPAMGSYSAHDSRSYLVPTPSTTSTTWLFGTMGGLWRTSDGGGSWTMVSSNIFHGSLYETTDGTLYLGGTQGVLHSTDGIAWTNVPNSGQLIGGITSDGNSLYASSLASCIDVGQNLQTYESSAANDGTSWMAMPSPGMTQGGGQLGYEADHHVLYSSNCAQGLWRVRLQ